MEAENAEKKHSELRQLVSDPSSHAREKYW